MSRAVSESSLEELLAERIADEAVRIADERIKAMFEVTEFDPDEVFGFMGSEEAAMFLSLPYSSFREIAPDLPRHAITPARFGQVIVFHESLVLLDEVVSLGLPVALLYGLLFSRGSGCRLTFLNLACR